MNQGRERLSLVHHTLWSLQKDNPATVLFHFDTAIWSGPSVETL